MHSGKIAAIDLGTNTFHLLIVQTQADGSFKTIHQENATAKIGQGGISKGVLTEEACQRALGILHHFRQQLDTYGVALCKVAATATSAIRNAQNGQELVKDIETRTGIQVRIISGDQEAEFIYYGVRQALSIGTDAPSFIMDIGGGSVEFIICNQKKMFWKQSVEIGAQRLLDLFMPTDPISTNAIGRLNDYLEENLIALTNAVHQYAPETLIGASGAFETLCAIEAGRNGKELDTTLFREGALPLPAYAHIHHELIHKNKAERLAIPGMLEMRVDMIVVASCLLNFVIRKYAIKQMRVSAYALKEGVLSQMILNM